MLASRLPYTRCPLPLIRYECGTHWEKPAADEESNVGQPGSMFRRLLLPDDSKSAITTEQQRHMEKESTVEK